MSSAASQIAMIKQKAHDLHLAHKAQEVAMFLGNENQKKHGSWWKFDDKKMGIEYDDYGNNIEVCWEGQRVLGTQTGTLNRAVLQTPWMKHLDNLYGASQKIRKEQEKAIKEQEAREEEEMWRDETLEGNLQTIPPKTIDISGLSDNERQKIVDYVKNTPWTKKGDEQ